MASIVANKAANKAANNSQSNYKFPYGRFISKNASSLNKLIHFINATKLVVYKMGRLGVLAGVFVGVLVLVLAGCVQQDARMVTLEGQTFGTTYSIKYLDQPHSPGKDTIHEAVKKRLVEIDNIMSTWNDKSEITKLNATPVNEKLYISDELMELLAISDEIYHSSLETFDISVGPLVRIWRAKDRGENEIPTDAEIEKARELIGLDYLELGLDDNSVTKHRQLDLTVDAIGKGYGVDEIGKVIAGFGISDYLVEIGGEILAQGSRSRTGKNDDDSGWRVAIEQPDELLRSSFGVFVLQDQAMATSGDYRNYYEKDGVRYSHIIDPRTARPVTHRLASVSVVHPSTTYADAWATALFVLGENEGLQVANDFGIAAYFIARSDEGFVATQSNEFANIITNN